MQNNNHINLYNLPPNFPCEWTRRRLHHNCSQGYFIFLLHICKHANSRIHDSSDFAFCFALLSASLLTFFVFVLSYVVRLRDGARITSENSKVCLTQPISSHANLLCQWRQCSEAELTDTGARVLSTRREARPAGSVFDFWNNNLILFLKKKRKWKAEQIEEWCESKYKMNIDSFRFGKRSEWSQIWTKCTYSLKRTGVVWQG